jgi:hypothetical protein
MNFFVPKIDYRLLTFIAVGGSIVLASYYYYLPALMKDGISLDKLWGNIKGNTRQFYLASMILSSISFFYMTWVLVTSNLSASQSALVWSGLLIFFIGSSLWTPFLATYFRKQTNQVPMYAMLGLTTLGIMLLFIHFMSSPGILSKVAVSLFLFHILILDNTNYAIQFEKNIVNA